ncbi:hypothetical protein QJS83_11730 [Bdellovibrio sp. 22V]|uniref:hypothetical protein n=1 Tax=Bdellovibrio TaxID=958 RepID=UPI002542A5B6|nr:hypothetical protein [Bdellovibrio sp. 22V]WII71131.1 hypothetical protein QJS83_11730 [Bdellovibrio sp. 22V]
MKKIFFVLLSVLAFTPPSHAQGLQAFLKSCAWGTLGGAAVGVASLAVEDQPGESWNNVARGASLGLYAGIAYGLYQANKEPKTYQQPDFAVFPKMDNGSVDGIEVSATIVNF